MKHFGASFSRVSLSRFNFLVWTEFGKNLLFPANSQILEKLMFPAEIIKTQFSKYSFTQVPKVLTDHYALFTDRKYEVLSKLYKELTRTFIRS